MKVTELKLKELPGWFLRSLVGTYSYLSFYLPHVDDASQLLPQIIKAIEKKLKGKGEAYRGEWRAIKMLTRITTSKEVIEGKLLVSFFCDTYCERDKQIHARVIEDTSGPEFSEDPENVGYDMEFLEWALSDDDVLPRYGEYFPHEYVVSRKRQTRADKPFVTCDACGGSGRRRMWVIMGTGERVCPKCQGQGKREILVPDYMLEESVWDIWGQCVCVASTLSLTGESLYWDDDSLVEDDRKAEVRHVVSGDDCISLKKIREEVLVDNTGAYMEEFKRLGLHEAYQKHCKFAEYVVEAGVMCRQERHYIVPVTCIRINTHRIIKKESDDKSFDIYIFPYDAKQDLVIVGSYIDSMEKFEYLITWLLSS